MPSGKVKWYDAEKGFGFLSQEGGDDVYVRAEALPEGTTSLKPGTRVEFGIAQGRRGEQALQVRVLEATASVARLLRGLADDGLSVILVVHDLALAAAVADTVVVMANGRSAATGTPKDVLTPERLREIWGVQASLDDSGALHVNWLQR